MNAAKRAAAPLARACAPALLLFALLLSGCGETSEPKPAPDASPAPTPAATASPALPTGEETLTSILDRDGSDGYAGELVLVYHPALWDSGSKSMGSLDGLVETTQHRVPTRPDTYLKTARLYNEADPYLTDAARQADPCYELTDGDRWQTGFQYIFHVGDQCPDEMLFQVSAVGERCRVWSPVNPDYGPLEGLKPSYPDRLAREWTGPSPSWSRSSAPSPISAGTEK